MAFHLDSEESDATPTDSHFSPMAQILVSQQMPSSQQSNLMSTLEQDQLSPENRSDKLSSKDSSSKSLKSTKGKEMSAAEIAVPQLIGPGEGEEHVYYRNIKAIPYFVVYTDLNVLHKR